MSAQPWHNIGVDLLLWKPGLAIQPNGELMTKPPGIHGYSLHMCYNYLFPSPIHISRHLKKNDAWYMGLLVWIPRLAILPTGMGMNRPKTMPESNVHAIWMCNNYLFCWWIQHPTIDEWVYWFELNGWQFEPPEIRHDLHQDEMLKVVPQSLFQKLPLGKSW